MQKLEKYYGVKAEISDHLEPENVQDLMRIASKYAFLEKLALSSYMVYFHFLTINAEESHFGVSGGVASRVKEFTLAFNVNQKQRERPGGAQPKIRFINCVFRESDRKLFEFLGRATQDELVYFIPATYFQETRTFQNLIITFVKREVRADHRKIKVSLSATPT